jgi:hypothetical protein
MANTMTGDPVDMLARLRSVLPQRWFPDETPVLDALLSGLAASWAFLYSQLSYAARQARLATATDAWLDLIANDFFARRLARRAAEPDDAFRQRIRQELARERGTRRALASALSDLTGRAPVVFEPARATDTGAWGMGFAWGAAGGWGNLSLPFQCFVTAFRPHASGIATVAGYGTGGPLQYANLKMVQGQVTDADIMATVAGVLPVATIAWTRISD